MSARRDWNTARADSRNMKRNLGNVHGGPGGTRQKQLSLCDWTQMAATGKAPNFATSTPHSKQYSNTPKHKDRSNEINIDELSAEKDPKSYRFRNSPDASGSYIDNNRQVFHDNMGVTQIRKELPNFTPFRLDGRNGSGAKISPMPAYGLRKSTEAASRDGGRLVTIRGPRWGDHFKIYLYLLVYLQLFRIKI